MKINNIWKAIIAVVVSELAGVIGSIFTVSEIPNWYAGLQKPFLNPPSWIFGPVWTTLYLLMGIAAFLVWKNSQNPVETKKAAWVFGLQLLLNTSWSIVFFKFHNPGLAFVNIVLMWLAIVWTIVVFRKTSKTAAYLLIPYLLWVTFASYLNLSIWLALK